ncbi:MAG: hypothetical protein IT290_08690, partial [Deltaproteobacteria bacterium]|nr:hypothetical protein [Deltaproteobacteria bacterium]
AIEKGRGALLEATIDGVLPVDDVESCANGVHKAALFGQKIENPYQLCKYRDGMTLSFMRIPASQVMATFDAMSKSQEGKDLIK